MKRVTFWLLVLLTTQVSAGEVDCGLVSKPGQFGPFDYRDPANRKKTLPTVEAYHFTPNVENLMKGESSESIGSDLSYVLQAFPNHHRALNTMIRLAERKKTNQPHGSKYTVECWFDRAVRFRADDGTVRMLFGNHLSQRGKLDDALEQFKEAERLMPNSPNILYNFGLLYFERKNYDKALEYAQKASGMGFPLDGLKNKLRRVGKWQ
jgi:tetratricopeptide (TPR) repeat protein